MVYDLERNEAYFGAARVDGPAVVWELTDEPGPGEWILRCDRVDFPPGGIAYRHVHPGGGIRRILFGELTIDRDGDTRDVHGRGVVARGRRRPGARHGLRLRGHGLRPGHAAPRRVGRAQDDPLRRSGGRGQAAAPARDGPARGAAVRTGGRILVDQLELNGADLAFCLPGESYLPVLDALYDSPIRLVTCRHEQGAANAAEAYGKLTGRPGICLVTRGPGATQAAVGVHTAKQDSSPMLLLVGQVPRAFRGREAWQELDYAQVFGGIAKAAWEIDSAERIPEHMAEAFSTALSGRPGPVVLALPEDVLAEEADVADGARVEVPRLGPQADDLERLRELLADVRAPARRRRRGRLDRGDEPRRAGVLRGERAPGRVRVPLPGLRRQPLVELRRRARGRDGRSDRRSSARRRPRPRDRRSAGRGADASVHAPRAAGPEADARPHPSRSRRARTRVRARPRDRGDASRGRRRAARARSGRAALARVDGSGARRVRGEPPARADGGGRRPGRDHGVPPAAASRRRGPDVRRGQLHRLGASLRRVHAVRHAGMSAQRLDGVRAPGRCRCAADPSGPRRRLLHGRRRLRHELARARDRRAVRAADRRAPRQQRHVRDHPHAPGAAVPGSRDRHRSRQPRLPDARAGVRCARRARRGDRRTSRPRSSARSHPASRRCSSCRSTPSGSARASSSAS